MASLGWLSLIGTAGCVVVLGAAVSFGARQSDRRARQGVPPATPSDPSILAAASEGHAGNKPRPRRDRYVASDPPARRVP